MRVSPWTCYGESMAKLNETDVHPLLGDPRLKGIIGEAARTYGVEHGSSKHFGWPCMAYGELWLARVCHTGVEPTAPTKNQSSSGLTAEHAQAINTLCREVLRERMPRLLADAAAIADRFDIDVPTPSPVTSSLDVNSQAPDPSTW